jgi:hypothetical protein
MQTRHSSAYKSVQVDSSMKTAAYTDDFYLSRCRRQVEEKLGWGSSCNWSHADYLEASEKISEVSGISLSITTIKRVWGKVAYKGTPAVSTLNALAVYLGYENWRSFKQDQDTLLEEGKHEATQEAVPDETPASFTAPPPAKSSKRVHATPFITILLLLVAAAYFFSAKEKATEPVLEGNILFNSKAVTGSLPNTVIFNYDLSAFAFDSAFIQQDWDPSRRQKIDGKNKQLTSVYYYPGHFNAKLIVNDKVVKEHGLLVPTDGWLGIVDPEEASTPTYINPQDFSGRGSLSVSPEVLAEHHVNSQKSFYLTFSNAQRYEVDGDNFTLEAAVRNNIKEGGLTCQETYVLLGGETGIIWFPLSAPGCIGTLALRFGEVYVDGKLTDLSAFGADLSDWNHIRCQVKNRQVELFVNNRLIYASAFEKPLGKLMGLNFKFHGAGAVKYVRLLNAAGNVAYEDEFNTP